MANTEDEKRTQQAAAISSTLNKLGINITLGYAAVDGAGDHYYFTEAGGTTPLTLPELNNRIGNAKVQGEVESIWYNNLRNMITTQTDSKLGKEFKKIFGKKESKPENLAIIPANGANADSMDALAAQAPVLDNVRVFSWDLSEKGIKSYLDKTGTAQDQKAGYDNLVNVTEALTLIGGGLKQDITFRIDKNRNVVYTSNTLSGAELNTAAQNVIEHVLKQDVSLTSGGKLNEKGNAALNAIATGGKLNLSDSATKRPLGEFVNLIENDNLLLAIGKEGVIVTQDAKGNDIYGKANAGAQQPAQKTQAPKPDFHFNITPQTKQLLNAIKGKSGANGFSELDNGTLPETEAMGRMGKFLYENASDPFSAASGLPEKKGPAKAKGK